MKDFKVICICEKLKISLFVFQPASPKINGNVVNRIITEEFLHETLEDSLVVY